jgi:hypothetical protein
LQRQSGHFAFVAKFMSTAFFLYVCFGLFLPLLRVGIGSGAARDLYLAALVTFGGTALVSSAAKKLGEMVDVSIRHIAPLSYLDLTKGDKNALVELKNENRQRWIKGALSLGATILTNLGSSWLASKIGLGQ